MKWFNRKDIRLLGIGLFLVSWPIPIYGLALFLHKIDAKGGAYKVLGILAVYVGPGSIVFGLIIFALYLISEVLLLPWRLSQRSKDKRGSSAND